MLFQTVTTASANQRGNDNLVKIDYFAGDRCSEVAMSTDSRQLAAGGSADFRDGDCAAEALDLMARALALLDANEAPADAGAYLDHAMHRLRQWIGDGALK